MDAKLAAKLERIKNYHTRYELALENSEGRRILLGYTPRRSRAGMLSAMRRDEIGPAIVKLTGVDEIRFAKKASDGGTIGEWKFKWTGRTQREAYISGELEFILNVK